MSAEQDRKAPMASAPIKYRDDGQVDWGNMWDAFCVLAKDGGPPHRETVLVAPSDPDSDSEGYRFATGEIIRGIHEVSGLEAWPGAPGWVAVRCKSAGMALWLEEAIALENVQARSQGAVLLVPVGDNFSLKGEIKNVITAVAKTTHYWKEHMPADMKLAITVESRVKGVQKGLRRLLSRQPV